MLCTEIVSDIQNSFCTQHVLPMFCKKKSFWQRFTCINSNQIFRWSFEERNPVFEIVHQRKKSVPDKSICFTIEKVSHLQFEKKCVFIILYILIQLYNFRVFHQLKLNNCSLDSHLAYTNFAKIKETRLKSIQDSELMLYQGAFLTCFFKIDFSNWLIQNGLLFRNLSPEQFSMNL